MFKRICWSVILINYAAINYCVFAGTNFIDVSLLFQERQAITFLSALQLAFTALVALSIYVSGRILYKNDLSRLGDIRVWLVSSIVFALCTIDEYFMLHEGIDGGIATIFLGSRENPNLDGITLTLYGIAALLVFHRFRGEILRHPVAITFFIAGGIFFLGSIGLDVGSDELKFRIILEETSKLIAVALILLGHISILADNIRVLDRRVNPQNPAKS